MKIIPWFALAVLLGCSLGGCTNAPAEKTKQLSKEEKEEKIQTALAKLSPEDRKLADTQKFCAVQTGHRLGSMDTPVKVMIKGQPVFLCCDSCSDEAKNNQDKTLQTANDQKKRTK